MAAAAGLLFFPQARADLNPANWHSVAIGEAETNNVWYFWPDAQNNPRIMVKGFSQNAKVKRALIDFTPAMNLTPPSWTLGPLDEITGANKEGFFVPDGSDGGDLVVPHASGGTQKLKCVSFQGGSMAVTEIDPNAATTISSVSASRDSSGNLHVAYVWNPGLATEELCYARRDTSGQWSFTSVELNGSVAAEVKGTAVVASGLNDVRLFFTLDTAQTVTLFKATPKEIGGILTIVHQTTPLVNIENFVDYSVSAVRFNSSDRVFYFAVSSATTRVLKRWVTGGTISDLQTATVASGPLPRSIRTATAPDGKQRVAWYEGRTRRIHYLKPVSTASELPYTAGQPVQLATNASNIPDSDLLGFQFGADGRPYLLSRRLLGEGFVSFPKDDFDLNGNGRMDLFDAAFNSTNASVIALPIDKTEKRLKLRFPTIGSSAANTAGVNVATVTSAEENLKYAIQTSTDMVNWSTINNTANVTYTFTNDGGSNPNQRRTFTAVLSGEAPGSVPKRFARLSVTRLAQPLY